MISNSRMQITLLSFLFKKINIIKKGINIKYTLKLYAVLFTVVSYTQRPSGFKQIIKSIFKTNLPSPILSPFLSEKAFEIYKIFTKAKMRAEMKYIWKKFINHQIKKCLLFRCRHAVVIMQILNWTNQCWLFMTVRYIMRSVRMHTTASMYKMGTELRSNYGSFKISV